MDLAALRARVLTVNFFAHGVAVTVTRPAPDDAPIATRGVWDTTTTGDMPAGAFTRKEPRRVISLKKSDVPAIPRLTLIEAPEQGQTRTWLVDGVEGTDVDHWRVTVTRRRPE